MKLRLFVLFCFIHGNVAKRNTNARFTRLLPLTMIMFMFLCGCGSAPDTGSTAGNEKVIEVESTAGNETVIDVESTAGNETVADEGSASGNEKTGDSRSSVADVVEDEISIIMVGDLLVHKAVYESGIREDGTLNYDHLFTNVSDDIKKADIAVINNEVIYGGNDIGYRDYPEFNVPTEIGDAVYNAGFNVILHASNHTLDQGTEGIENCLEFWNTSHPDAMILGIHGLESGNYTEAEEAEKQDSEEKSYTDTEEAGKQDSEGKSYTDTEESGKQDSEGKSYTDMTESGESEQRREIRDFTIYEKNGIKIAMLNYTYGLNGKSLPDKMSYMIDLMDETSKDKIREDIRKARELSDAVIVFPHWGTEYSFEVDESEKEWAEFFADEGVLLVIGSHPHVVEPIEWIEGREGNKMLCYYSVGNYISSQTNADAMLGLMAKVKIGRDKDGNVVISDYGYETLVTHISAEPGEFTTYKLTDYTDEMAARNAVCGYDDRFSLQFLKNLESEVFESVDN
ncbi:MAG: CapA family protein [Eubacterium sp.]|nr:CapA family protein [Eubacterium sp.]